MSVAATIMCWPEPTKERVERTTLGITAIEIPQSTRFTLLWASCYEFIVRPICVINTSSLYFPFHKLKAATINSWLWPLLRTSGEGFAF